MIIPASVTLLRHALLRLISTHSVEAGCAQTGETALLGTPLSLMQSDLASQHWRKASFLAGYSAGNPARQTGRPLAFVK
jgi:hypothetical protein